MFETYYPRKFCREYVELKGFNQLIMFMAVVKGIKPLMDDWIEKDKFAAYQKLCQKYGVYLKPDVVFFDINDPVLKQQAIGKETLTTTKARGLPFESAKDGFVHVFVSHSKTKTEKGFQNGWYPLIIKNRVINKPYIDLLKFGYDLGYPDCCVRFFRRYNDWRYFSHLYQTLKNTMGRPSYLCNNLAKILGFSYFFHLPCSFSCPQSIRLAKKIRLAVLKEEPPLAEVIDGHLRLPYLVFYEDKIYAFEGEVKKNRLDYEKVYFIGNDPNRNSYQHLFNKGNSLYLKKGTVSIYKNSKLKERIIVSDAGQAPEIPFLTNFH